MIYAIVNQDGVTEIREDSYVLKDNAIPLTDEQYDKLITGIFILQGNELVNNPNPQKP